MKVFFVLMVIGCHFSTVQLLWITDYSLSGNDSLEGSGNCSNSQFKCLNTSTCIPQIWRCDGFRDCNDNSDEDDCVGCPEDKFKCNSSAKCIPASWICDKFQDCDDNSDEINCPTTLKPFASHTSETNEFKGCGQGQVQCYNSTRCISQYWICDNYTDCEDNSDEIDCYRKQYYNHPTTPDPETAEVYGCGQNQVQCNNSTRCIPRHWICDNYTDCEDNSDEIDCYRKYYYNQPSTAKYETTEFHGCGQGQVQCNNSTRCIPRHWICDNYTDCDDNSDEIDCYRKSYTLKPQTTEYQGCGQGQVKCYNSTRCISRYWICDNYTDCEDNSDEIDCYRKYYYNQPSTAKYETTEFHGCGQGQVQCNNSTRCIPQYWICDNYTDCDDNSDEIDCYDKPTHQPPSYNQSSTSHQESQQTGSV